MSLDTMPLANGTTLSDDTLRAAEKKAPVVSELQAMLERAYGRQFTILDGRSGEVIFAAPKQPHRDWTRYTEICRTVSAGNRPEFIDDEDPFLTLALPWQDNSGNEFMAAAVFLSRKPEANEDLGAPARMLGMEVEEAAAWAASQTPCQPESLLRLGEMVLDGVKLRHRIRALLAENDKLALNLTATYEEISLLYRLTQGLKISRSDEELGALALEWMQEVIPAAGLALLLAPLPTAKTAPQTGRTQPLLLSRGECLLDIPQFSALLKHLGVEATKHPLVVNRTTTSQDDWPWPQIRQMIVAVLSDGESSYGWLAAINHVSDAEFGTVEANLLSSVAAILGIHGGNIALYRQQAEMLAGVVRALSSAIDAKDPYTCGHSERVAHVAVRLAKELGCDSKTLTTLYLAGLLHDIGKIGIDDGILRKSGRLSDEEYEHVKRHTQIGHRILHDLAKMEEVLPVVLHHHESWDGRGYPDRLAGEHIPLGARIVAVADAYDAMHSDRPYRKGMADERIEEIFRQGAGKQWDPAVVEAFFRCREELHRICQDRPQDTPFLSFA